MTDMVALREVISLVNDLGGSAGLVVPLGNAGWVRVLSMRARIDTTATKGERVVAFALRNSAGQVHFTAVAVEPVPASSEAVISLGGGVGVSEVDLDIVPPTTWITLPLPAHMCLPPNSQVVVRDANNADVADAVALFTAVVEDL